MDFIPRRPGAACAFVKRDTLASPWTLVYSISSMFVDVATM